MNEDVEWFHCREYAGPGGKFAPGCLDSQIGAHVPVTRDGHTATGTIAGYQIAPDGSWFELNVKVPRGTLPPTRLSAVSIGKRQTG